MFKNVGRALTLIRELRGKTQATVASHSGIGKSQLSKYENGKEIPKLESLERVLDCLGIGSFEFFYTVHLLDQRAASLGEVPNDMDSAASAVWATGGLASLSPATEEAFASVFILLMRLYRQFLETLLRGPSAPRAIGASPHPEPRDE